MKLVIPAGGVGTRLLPVTKEIAKEMLPMTDKPLLQYMVEQGKEANMKESVIIISPDKKYVANHFKTDKKLAEILKAKKKKEILKKVKDAEKLNVDFAVQRKPLGDGDALMRAKRKIGRGSFLVCFGDTLFYDTKKVFKELIDLHKKTGACVVGVKEVKKEEVSSYGIVATKLEKGRHVVKKLVEKPSIEEAPSRLALVGVYVLTEDVWRELKTAPSGKDGELRLADALIQMMEKEKVYACPIKSTWLDTGDFLGYLRASVHLAKKDKKMGPSVRKFLQEKMR